MKALALLIAIAFTGIASARPVPLEWDRNPEPDVVEYRLYLYDLLDDDFKVVGTVIDDPATPENDTPTTVAPEIPNVVSRVYVTAFNTAGLESIPSVEFVIAPDPPGAPGGLRRVLSLQTSTDGQQWETLADYYLPANAPLYARMEIKEEPIAP